MFNGKEKSLYADDSVNTIYNLLFCDNTELYKKNNQQPYEYPWNILFADKIAITDLQKIIGDDNMESRQKILAYSILKKCGIDAGKQEILGVIVEVGLEQGLDVVAAYKDGSARYINQTGKIIIWESPDETSLQLTNDLLEKSKEIVEQIGPWDQARRPFPAKNMVRISFMVSDGFYFGEGPANVFFNDPLARPALYSAASLMQFLTEKVLSDAQVE